VVERPAYSVASSIAATTFILDTMFFFWNSSSAKIIINTALSIARHLRIYTQNTTFFSLLREFVSFNTKSFYMQ